jgi:flagellar basal-body rod protein FlgG
MNSGLYAALSGNLAAMRKLDIVANNLANASTTGFKKDRLAFQSLLAGASTAPLPPGSPTDAPVLSGEIFYTDYSAGSVKNTGNPLDLALGGDGFFVVNTPQGRAYTRNGSFSRDVSGKLVTSEGYEVLGGGPIEIRGSLVEIDSEGKVMVDGSQVGTLDIVDFPKPYALQKTGNSLFVPTNPAAAPEPVTSAIVHQGFVEDSNVNTVQEMVQMIETNRYFETCAKVVKNFDDVTSKAVNELARV